MSEKINNQLTETNNVDLKELQSYKKDVVTLKTKIEDDVKKKNTPSTKVMSGFLSSIKEAFGDTHLVKKSQTMQKFVLGETETKLPDGKTRVERKTLFIHPTGISVSKTYLDFLDDEKRDSDGNRILADNGKSFDEERYDVLPNWNRLSFPSDGGEPLEISAVVFNTTIRPKVEKTLKTILQMETESKEK